MTPIQPLTLLLALSAALALQSVPSDAATPSGEAAVAAAVQKAGLRVGVVDFVKVIDAYPRAIQERGKMEDAAKQQLAMLEAKGREANQIRLERDDLKKGTTERDLKELELRMKAQELDGFEQVVNEDRRRRIEAFYVMIYDDIRRAVEIVAKERGVDLVLRMHPDLADGSTNTKARVFDARVVWYAAEDIDLTAAVIQRLQTPLLPDPKAAGASAEPKKPEAQKETTGGKQGN